ncbi:MAG: hypothetical protein Kow0069_26750 [Promethearchaeota archaeon]
MSSESARNKRATAWRVTFVVAAVGAVLAPVVVASFFDEELARAFGPVERREDDAIYWQVGAVAAFGLFGLLAAYMIFSALRANLSRLARVTGAVWAPLLMVVVIGGLVLVGLNVVPENRGPYLSWTRDPKTTMTVTWETKSPATDALLWGESESSVDVEVAANVTPARAEDGYYHYSVTLRGLSPGTKYYYRVPGLQTRPASFSTAPSGASAKFKFVLYGDSREYDRVIENEHVELVRTILSTVPADELAFVINTGDLSRTHDFVHGWNLHFLAIRDLASRVPYLVASGNHEWNTASSFDQVDQPANAIQEFPSNDFPAEDVGGLNETSFAFGYGAAYFIFLGYPHAGSDDSAVLQWFEQQLAHANATHEFTFVSLHRPPFDRRSGGYNDALDVIEHDLPLVYLGGVDAVFSGHNHVLAHQEVAWDGDPSGRNVTYVVSGGGGAGLRDALYGQWDDNYGLGYRGRTVFAKKVNHFYVVEVDGAAGTATFSAVDADGNAVYPSFTLTSFK